MKAKPVATIFLILHVMMTFSFTQNKAEWKGIIEEKDGVIIVKNPKEPMYGENVFQLKEDLTIGEASGSKEQMFSEIRGLEADDGGRIYVLDTLEAHIKVFDKNGIYVKTIGREGQGPGEIGAPRSVFITSQNEVVVPDMSNRRLVLFSLEGEFIKNISTAKTSLRSTRVDSEGNIIGIILIAEESWRHELNKFDSDMNTTFTFATAPAPSPSRFNTFMPRLRWALTNNDQVVCGYPQNYEIDIFNINGEAIRKIMKDYEPVEINREEMERLEQVSNTLNVFKLKYKSAYQEVLVDDKGNVFIMTWERETDKDGYYYDIFDSEGKYIAKIHLITTPQIIKKNKLYTIEEDEAGFQYVKRYKIIWNY